MVLMPPRKSDEKRLMGKPKPIKKKALSKTTSKTVRGTEALYGNTKKRRSEQPRSTKYKIAGEDGSYQLRYRKVYYN
jgi:hypothetical protein